MSMQPLTGRTRSRSLRVGARGFGLIELMIAMVLGLIVIAGVTSIFLANQQTYRANAGLSEIQEGSRIAFEMMARDVRNADMTGCDSSSGRVANVLTGGSTLWYADWTNAVIGYDDASTDPAISGLSGTGAPVANTSSIHLIGAATTAATINVDNESNIGKQFTLNEASASLQKGDLVMVCDYDHATIVQLDYYAAGTNATAGHSSSDNSVTPGITSDGLGYPNSTYQFPVNAQIAELDASDWYIGANSAGTQSLYRYTPVNSAGKVTSTAEEMVRNVTGMTLKYNRKGTATFDTATTITSAGAWSSVDAVQIQLTLQSTNQRAGVNAQPISRTFTSVATVRNRVL